MGSFIVSTCMGLSSLSTTEHSPATNTQSLLDHRKGFSTGPGGTQVKLNGDSLCWYCSRYPMRTPLGSAGGVQRRFISVSDGLSRIRFMGGPGTRNSADKLWLKCIWLEGIIKLG